MIGQLIFLTGPLGTRLVRYAYFIGLLALVGYTVADVASAQSLDAATLLGALLLLVVGTLVLRLLAEVIGAHLDVRDKLGAIERNTQEARDKLGAIESNTQR